jgi:hypothetical protein
MNWFKSSVNVWFTALFLLNILDIATTMPLYESNPFTLFLWDRIGIFLSAWFKMSLVLLFGILCAVARKVANPCEWEFTSRVFRVTLGILVAYYAFVVAVNLVIKVSSLVGHLMLG